MQYDNFSKNVNKVLELSEQLAKRYDCHYIGSEHILFGLLNADDGRASTILKEAGVDNDRFLFLFKKTVDPHVRISGNMFTPRTKHLLDKSVEISLKARRGYVGTEHLLLALLLENDSLAASMLIKMRVDIDAMAEDIAESILAEDNENVSENDGYEPASAKFKPAKRGKEDDERDLEELSRFGINLNRRAAEGKLDPVIGRKNEIDRVIQILTRRTKNNPVLVGEPGVGKSAVVEGLAQAIVQGNVPEILSDKIIFSLDLAGMLSGARYRGDFEERLKKIIDIVKSNGKIVLFIDEIHNIVGAGSTGEGNMDAANILKPMLSRGELQTIGATTIDEYRKYIEKDAALERRFQPITVEAPSTEEAVEILKGLRDKYEAHHGVSIPDEAIMAAVTLSDRYITDRFLPDKAIDLIDEAASRVRLDSYNSPVEARQKENELNALIAEKNDAKRREDFEKAIRINKEITRVNKELDAIRAKAAKLAGKREKLTITAGDVAKVVSNWTGVPVVKLTETEAQKLLDLEETLHRRVIGQNAAVAAVAEAIRRSRAGLADPKRPIGSFIFVGPTGVGKTELTKALAEAVFGNENNLIRIDMSEYMEKHSVSKMVGAPPGYAGFDEAGQLTEKVRRRPYSVVLFDEIEKAHPDVFNILLQVLDDGRITDSQGRTVDFKNTVIILTSNLGSSVILDGIGENGEITDDAKAEVNSLLKKSFRPEFLNRLDEIVFYKPLTREEIGKIIDLFLKGLSDRLKEKNISLFVTESAKDFIVKNGYDPVYGARPLKRYISHSVETLLAKKIIAGYFEPNDTAVVDYDGDDLVVYKQK